MNYNIAVIDGDGVGGELTQRAKAILQRVGQVYGHKFNFTQVTAGTAALEKGLPPMPHKSLEACKNSHAIILGKVAVGRHQNLEFYQRPESIVAILRNELKLCSDVRPAFLWEQLKEACPLKESVRKKGLDVLVVRDISGGMFMGNGCRCDAKAERAALDTEYYSEQMINASAKLAFELAKTRKKSVTSLDKAILLSSSALWRQVVTEMALKHEDIMITHKLVDDAARELIEFPQKFDVILASNVFGDIIADEIAGLVGAGEVLPAASLNENMQGVYMPNQLHKALDEQKGKNTANPIGIILACAMLLEYSLGLKKEAESVRQAVKEALKDGLATQDFYSEGKQKSTTQQMADAIKIKIM